MFRTIIRQTPLTSCAAESVFQNIQGESFNGDYSFLASLRALVYPRMKKEDSLRLRFGATGYSASAVGQYSASKVVGAIIGDKPVIKYEESGTVYIHNFTGDAPEDNIACMELMKSYFESQYDGWHRLEKVTDFYRKTFYVLCFINTSRRSVILFTDSMDMRKMHYLQCSIFAFLPWYFDPKAGVSTLEMALINSLREKEPNTYEDCLAQIASQYDFRTQMIRDALAGFETRFERIECNKIRREIEGILDEIESLNNQMVRELQQKSEREIRLLGLESKIQNGESNDSEIMEYFLCNDKLVLESVTDNKITFSCMDYLTYFDEDMAKQMIDNRRGYIFRPNGRSCNNFIEEEDMKKLMYAIFIDQTLRIKICASYTLSLDGNVQANRNHTYGYEFRFCTPNPHIDAYSCIGDYRPAINRLLQKRDYVGAIEQCIASCKSLNFADSVVMSEFVSRIYGISERDVNVRCIELPDGNVVTPKQAIDWLKSQEGENESNE